MRFAEFIGQEQLLADLRGVIAQGRVGHAYLFVGPERCGRQTLARLFAQALLCEADAGRPCDACRSCVLAKAGTHPDLAVVQADGATIKIEQIRVVRAHVALKPLYGRGRVFLLAEMERLGEAAANSFLLTLEDPPPGVVFIGWALAGAPLLPTILSRFQVVKLQPMTVASLTAALVARGNAADEARQAAAVAGGLPGAALDLLGTGTGQALGQDDLAEALLRDDLPALFALAERLAHDDREAVERRLALLGRRLRDAVLAQGTGTASVDPLFAALAPATVWRLWQEAARGEEALRANANVRLMLDLLILAFFRERSDRGLA